MNESMEGSGSRLEAVRRKMKLISSTYKNHFIVFNFVVLRIDSDHAHKSEIVYCSRGLFGVRAGLLVWLMSQALEYNCVLACADQDYRLQKPHQKALQDLIVYTHQVGVGIEVIGLTPSSVIFG